MTNGIDTAKPLIDQLTKMIQEGYDLGKGQLPEIAKEIIRWAIWGNMLEILISVISLGVLWKYGIYVYDDKHWDDNLFKFIGVAIFFVVGCLLIIGAFVNLDQILKASIAPKLFLLDYLRQK